MGGEFSVLSNGRIFSGCGHNFSPGGQIVGSLKNPIEARCPKSGNSRRPPIDYSLFTVHCLKVPLRKPLLNFLDHLVHRLIHVCYTLFYVNHCKPSS